MNLKLISSHVLLTLAAIVGYIVLTETGHDGSPLFAFVGGQFAGAFVQEKARLQNGSGT